jgi:predicted dehydrogenase
VAPSIDFSEDSLYLFKDQVGILEAGAMGAEHAFSYGSIDAVEVVDVLSRNLARAEAITQRSSAKAVADVCALIDDPVIDAIDVCVPCP